MLAMLFLMQVAAPATADIAAVGDPSTWIKPKDYPMAALRARAEGTVRMRIDINADGLVSGCTILQTSGNPDLDAGSCEVLRRNSRYVRGPAGRSLSRQIVWRIPTDAEAAAALGKGTSFVPTAPLEVTTTSFLPSTTEVEITVGTDGAAESCRVVEKPRIGSSDPCRQFSRGMSMGVGFTRDGKPIRAIMHQRVTISTTFPDE